MKVYISGCISSCGNINKNIERFIKAEEYLKKSKHTVINPVRLKSLSWIKNVVRDISLIEKCDAVYFLPGWKKSYGARIEYLVAKKLNKIII